MTIREKYANFGRFTTEVKSVARRFDWRRASIPILRVETPAGGLDVVAFCRATRVCFTLAYWTEIRQSQ